MHIKRSGSQASRKGPEDYFTGTVRIDAPFSGSGGMSAATVTFEPRARTAWHTHPLGQTLLVTAGLGRVQREGGPIAEIRPGDIVWFERGERHWHGAAPDCAMTHIANCRNEGRLGRHLDGEGHGRAVRRGGAVTAEEPSPDQLFVEVRSNRGPIEEENL